MSHENDVRCLDAEVLTRGVQLMLPPVPGLPAGAEDQEEHLAAGLQQSEDGRPEEHDLIVRVGRNNQSSSRLVEMLQ